MQWGACLTRSSDCNLRDRSIALHKTRADIACSCAPVTRMKDCVCSACLLSCRVMKRNNVFRA